MLFVFFFLALAEARECPKPPTELAKLYSAEFLLDREYGERGLKLDMAWPKAEGIFPAIIFLHGGGWVSGSKDGFRQWLKLAAEKGFVGVAINYRLAKKIAEDKMENRFPAAAEDVNSAIDWIRTKASKYKINPERIFVFGESAGAHLALFSGLRADVKAIGNLYGPVDIVKLYTERGDLNKKLLEDVFGEKMKEASPIHLTSEASPPVITIHGTEDAVIPYAHAEILKAKLGSKNQLVSCLKELHGFTPENRARAFEHIFQFFAAQ